MATRRQKISVGKNRLPDLSRQRFLSVTNGSGFTVIEMAIVLFFAGILITVLFGLYDWHAKYYNYQQALVRVSGSSRTALQTMQSYVAQSSQVLAAATVNGSNYSSSANTLVLQLPATDASGNTIAGKSDKAAFYPSGGNFYFQLEPDPASSRKNLYKLLSDSLQTVSFTYNNASFPLVTKVSVNLLNQLKVKDQLIKSNLQENMYLLNH